VYVANVFTSAEGDPAAKAAENLVGLGRDVNEYWQDIYQTNFPPTYGKSMNGILGAGSLAFGTYFDGDPAWVYAIQMVPQNHWNNYLVRNKAYSFLQFSNLWSDRLNWQPLWSNSLPYASGTWVKYQGYIWCANTNLPAGHTLTDLQISNGSRVNGVAVTEVVLGPGDRIQLGETVLIVHGPTEA